MSSRGKLSNTGGQGCWRGSRRGSWHSGQKRWNSKGTLAPEPRTDPTGPIIDSINVSTLLVDETSPKIETVDYVASYNWVKSESPVILVPGSPPAWNPPAVDSQLQPDQHKAFWDLNAARWPSHPLEPSIQSLRVMRPDFDLPSVDILACGYTLSKLLDVVLNEAEDFRFDVDVIGETLFFTRRGASPGQLLPSVGGYGFRFRELYTSWDSEVQNSVSHQRIVNFSFGGLGILLRSGAGGYLPPISSTLKPGAKFESSPLPNNDADGQTPSNLPKTINQPTDNDKLKIEPEGKVVPQNGIFELKTRSINNKFDIKTLLPHLWLSQVPNVLIAHHERGLFNKPSVTNVEDEVRAWESANGHKIALFHALLKRITESVWDTEKQQCEISWSADRGILITEQVGEVRRALPPDLYKCFESRP